MEGAAEILKLPAGRFPRSSDLKLRGEPTDQKERCFASIAGVVRGSALGSMGMLVNQESSSEGKG
jgi:hypothetical protein